MPDTTKKPEPVRAILTSPLPSPMQQTFKELSENVTFFESPARSIHSSSNSSEEFQTPGAILTPAPVAIPAPPPTLGPIVIGPQDTPVYPVRTRYGRVIRLPRNLLDYMTDLPTGKQNIRTTTKAPEPAIKLTEPAADPVPEATQPVKIKLKEDTKPEQKPPRPLSPEVIIFDQNQGVRPKTKSILKAPGQKSDKQKTFRLQHDGRGESESPEQTVFGDKSDLYQTAVEDLPGLQEETQNEPEDEESMVDEVNRRFGTQAQAQPVKQQTTPQTAPNWRQTETATPGDTPARPRREITTQDLSDFFTNMLRSRKKPPMDETSSPVVEMPEQQPRQPMIRPATFKPVASTPIRSENENLDATEPMDFSEIHAPTPRNVVNEPMDFSFIKTPSKQIQGDHFQWRPGKYDTTLPEEPANKDDSVLSPISTGPEERLPPPRFLIKPSQLYPPLEKPDFIDPRLTTPMKVNTTGPSFYTPVRSPSVSVTPRAMLTDPLSVSGNASATDTQDPLSLTPVDPLSITPSDLDHLNLSKVNPEIAPRYNFRKGVSKTPPPEESEEIAPPPVRRVLSAGHPPMTQPDFTKELEKHLKNLQQEVNSPPRIITPPPPPAASPVIQPQQQQQQQPEQAQQQPAQAQDLNDNPEANQQHPEPGQQQPGAEPRRRGRPRKDEQQQPGGNQQPPGPEPRRSSRLRKEPDRFGEWQ